VQTFWALVPHVPAVIWLQVKPMYLHEVSSAPAVGAVPPPHVAAQACLIDLVAPPEQVVDTMLAWQSDAALLPQPPDFNWLQVYMPMYLHEASSVAAVGAVVLPPPAPQVPPAALSTALTVHFVFQFGSGMNMLVCT
jgi:hypothetical protein